MKLACLLIALAIFAELTDWAVAQVPPNISYQSSVTVSGTNYHGQGHFKFALVDRLGVTTYWSNDGSSTAAAEPRSSIQLEVTQGVFQVLLGNPGIPGMLPIPASVFENPDVHVRVWFSNGQIPFQHVAPDEAVSSVGYAMVAAHVARGAVTTAQLADSAVTATKLAPGAVTSSNLSPAAVGPAHLAPNAAAANLQASGALILSDQSVATNLMEAGLRRIGTLLAEADRWQTNGPFLPVGRANHAGIWANGEMIVVGGSVAEGGDLFGGARYTPSKDAWERVKSHAQRLQPYATNPAFAAWTGDEIILLNTAGRAHAAYQPATDTWRNLSISNAPIFSWSGACLAWADGELLVWGTTANSTAGRRYDPAANRWSSMAFVNQPSPRQDATSVWTGREWIIWGGLGSGMQVLATGARYHPATDTWRPISRTNAPSARTGHSALWTGTRMIVWGGYVGGTDPTTRHGGIYDPDTDTWKAVALDGAPSGRRSHSAVWTGTEMVIWGGFPQTNTAVRGFLPLSDGGRYNPLTDSWRPISPSPAPALIGQSTVWSGSEMIVWGGGSPRLASMGPSSPSGAITERNFSHLGWRYRPATDEWRPTAFAPSPSTGHSAVWTGEEWIVWGGTTFFASPQSLPPMDTLLGNGGRYNPTTGRWTPLSLVNAPTPRTDHRAVWTGREMIVWGGMGIMSNRATELTSSYLQSGARYHPATDTWTRMETNGAPSPRAGFTAVWTGEEFIVFGGRGTGDVVRTIGFLNSGARYRPGDNSWTAMTKEQAPQPRQSHTAVWTGKEMLVWGGETNLSVAGLSGRPCNTGAGYDPRHNVWRPLSTITAPTARRGHLAVWTGHTMLIWGGDTPANRVGGRYSPFNDRWEPMSATAAMPTIAAGQSAVWTGEEMIVWGGLTPTSYSAQAGRYNPITDIWVRGTTLGTPIGRVNHRAVWTGKEMLIFGGNGNFGNQVNAVDRYQLTTPLYLYGKP